MASVLRVVERDDVDAAKSAAHQAYDAWEQAQHVYYRTVAAMVRELGVRGTARELDVSPAHVSQLVRKAQQGPSGRGPGKAD